MKSSKLFFLCLCILKTFRLKYILMSLLWEDFGFICELHTCTNLKCIFNSVSVQFSTCGTVYLPNEFETRNQRPVNGSMQVLNTNWGGNTGQYTDIHGMNNCIHHAIKTTWRVFRVGFRFKIQGDPWNLGWMFTHFSGMQMNLWKDIFELRRKKWTYDWYRSYTHNLSSCEIKAWKTLRPERDSNPRPLRYRCSALPTIKPSGSWSLCEFVIYPLKV